MPKVSVIIPVYGVELYIGKCAKSLFEQSLENIEFIFVDDCTKDNSIAIIQQLLENYPNRKKQTLILHHEENLGLPKARLTGIQKATGEYIVHCDGDDWIELDMYQSMYELAIAENSDIVICDYFRVKKENIVKCKACMKGLSKEEIYKKMFSQEVPFMVWNKMIRKELYFKDITYPSHTHAEDMCLILQLSYYAKKVSYLPRALYYYIINSNTALHVYNEETYIRKFNDSINNVMLLEKFYDDKPKSNTITNGLVYLKLSQRDKLITLLKQDKFYKIWMSTFPEINSHLLFNPDIKIKHKIKYILTKYRIWQFKS